MQVYEWAHVWWEWKDIWHHRIQHYQSLLCIFEEIYKVPREVLSAMRKSDTLQLLERNTQ